MCCYFTSFWKTIDSTDFASFAKDWCWLKDIFKMTAITTVSVFVLIIVMSTVTSHGPLTDRDSEDISMGRKVQRKHPGSRHGGGSPLSNPYPNPSSKHQASSASSLGMSTKWCSMAKSCNHDRVPVCGVSHAGDLVGFRDLCDMFDYNCIRKRNYRQTACPDDKSMLTVSRRPTNSFYDD